MEKSKSKQPIKSQTKQKILKQYVILKKTIVNQYLLKSQTQKTTRASPNKVTQKVKSQKRRKQNRHNSKQIKQIMSEKKVAKKSK